MENGDAMTKLQKSAVATRRPETDNSVCARCGAFFMCGMTEGHDHCWCADLPLLCIPLDPTIQSCYCPACLKEAIAERSAE